MFWPLKFFGGVPPKFFYLWNGIIIQFITEHRAKFRTGRPTHLGDLVLKKTRVKLKSAPQAIASGWNN